MFANIRLIAVCLLFGGNAFATAPVAITNLTIAATPGENAAAYPIFTSPESDVLFSADSPCCSAVELHTHVKEGDVLKMREVDTVPLKAHDPVMFTSGGLHLMLIGLKKPLTAGDTIPVTFRFMNAPKQTVEFTVTPMALPAGSASPTHHH